MFFTFHQNNSGGDFFGPALNVIVEAKTLEEANSRAEELGLYFDGVDSGQDCGCCGDRWYQAWGEKGDSEPSIYDEPVQEAANNKTSFDWSTEEVPFALVYYTDGTKKVFRTKKHGG